MGFHARSLVRSEIAPFKGASIFTVIKRSKCEWERKKVNHTDLRSYSAYAGGASIRRILERSLCNLGDCTWILPEGIWRSDELPKRPQYLLQMSWLRERKGWERVRIPWLFISQSSLDLCHWNFFTLCLLWLWVIGERTFFYIKITIVLELTTNFVLPDVSGLAWSFITVQIRGGDCATTRLTLSFTEGVSPRGPQ